MTEEDRFKPYVTEVIRAQQQSIEHLDSIGVCTTNARLGMGGYYVGYKIVSEEERQTIVIEGKHVGILRRSGKDLLVKATYTDGTISALRFLAARSMSGQ